MSEFSLDMSKIETVREAALGGRCSVNVINTAGAAEKTLEGAGFVNGNQLRLLAPTMEFVVPREGVLDQGFYTEELVGEQDKNQHTGSILLTPFVEKVVNNEDDWIRVGLMQQAGSQLVYFASIKLNDPKHKCSVMVFEPQDEYDVAWSERIVATTDDEHAVLTEVNGDLRYNALAVAAVFNLITKHDIESFSHAAEILQLRSLVYQRLHAHQLDDSQKEVPETKIEFLRRVIAKKLETLRIGQTTELFEHRSQIEDTLTRGVASSFILSCCIERTAIDRGAINWPLVFGEEADKALVEAQYHPTTYVEAGTEFKFISDAGDVIVEPDESLEQLAKHLGYREVTTLPKPAIVSERVYAMHNEKPARYEFPDDIEQAKQVLADTIAYLAEEGRGIALGSLIKSFQRKFAQEIDLLDIGEVQVKSYSGDNFSHEARQLFHNATNLAGTIHAPGWYVLTLASACENVRVIDSASAFTQATNIRNCSVRNVTTAFFGAGHIQDCTVENADRAFETASYISRCTTTNCGNVFTLDNAMVLSHITIRQLDPKVSPLHHENIVINCGHAFEIRGTRVNYRSLGKTGIGNIRVALQGNIWLSQRSVFTGRPHRVVNKGRYWN